MHVTRSKRSLQAGNLRGTSLQSGFHLGPCKCSVISSLSLNAHHRLDHRLCSRSMLRRMPGSGSLLRTHRLSDKRQRRGTMSGYECRCSYSAMGNDGHIVPRIGCTRCSDSFWVIRRLGSRSKSRELQTSPVARCKMYLCPF